MINELFAEIKDIEISKSKIRTFISAFTIFALFVVVLVFKISGGFRDTTIVLLAIIFMVGMWRPMLLRSFYKITMAGSISFGFFMFKSLLIMIYYLILTPIAVIMRLTGTKGLENGTINKNKISYWVTVDDCDNDPRRVEHPY